jgi:nucleotide-binding universal stress UspA family protein
LIRTILVALDSSARAPGVLAAACEMAEKLGAKLATLRTISIPPDFAPAAHVAAGDPLPAFMTQEALAELETLVAAVPAGIVMDPPRVRIGQPWRAIVDAAEELDADLIVIGSHGYHGADRILGTTAGKVANLAKRSVLIVHAPVTPQ